MNIFSSVKDQLSSFAAGFRLVDGDDLLTLVRLTASGKGGLVARPGGGTQNAPILQQTFNTVSVVASDGDSVVLSPATAGTYCVVANNGGASLSVLAFPLNVFTKVADVILPYGSIVPQGSLSVVPGGLSVFYCAVPGTWQSVPSDLTTLSYVLGNTFKSNPGIGTPVSPGPNGNSAWETTSNTLAALKLRGSDGVVRYINLPLTTTGSPGDAGQALIEPGFFSNGTVPLRAGYFKDDTPATQIHRLRDRFFLGDGSEHTGRRTAPLGDTWLTDRGANYFEKNALISILTPVEDGRFALLVGQYLPATGTAVGGGGLAAVSINEQPGSFSARAGYFEIFLKADNGGSVAIEVETGNYSNTMPNPTVYGLGPGAYGIQLSVEAGYQYVTGDNNTPVPDATMPAAAAIYVNGGDLNPSFRRWKKGLLFMTNGLYRGTDGLNGNATAIEMAQNHSMDWRSAAGILNATIRSDGNATPNQDTAIIFNLRTVKIGGSGERAIAQFFDDTAGAGAVNFLQINNSRTGINSAFRAKAGPSGDANTGIDFSSLGTAPLRFQSHDGAGEHFRISPASQAVNFLQVSGSLAGANPLMVAAGTDANLSLVLRGKGTGGFLLQDGASGTKIQGGTAGLGFFGAAPTLQPLYGVPTGTSNRATFDTTTITLPDLAGVVKALVDDFHTYGLLG